MEGSGHLSRSQGGMMTATTECDPQLAEAFVGRVMSDVSATMTTLLASIGDRLGLFKAMSDGVPVSSAQLAQRTGTQERYAREWLGGMAAAGYVKYTAADGRFRLPVEHAPALARESGPGFFGGVLQMLPAYAALLEPVSEAFVRGGGVRQHQYPAAVWSGLERFSGGWFDNFLTQVWLPAMPEVLTRLERGADVADVGCGAGRALCVLAAHFPACRYVGYDVFAPAIERARDNARRTAVDGRVDFTQLDGRSPLPGRHDLIFAFDVLHDARDPRELLQQISDALSADGAFVCLEPKCSEHLSENLGPIGAMMHGFSMFYCMTTSLAQGGAGLGTLGMHEPRLRALCAEVGLSRVRRVPLDNPFHTLFEVRR